MRRALAANHMEMRIEHEPGRFVARIGDQEAELVYTRHGEVLDVTHTFTPPTLRGRGIAERLTEAAFAHARAEGLKVLPTCSYTRVYLAHHPELQALAAGL